MSKFFSYDIIQVATEMAHGVKDAITEIRFWHKITENGISKQRLYVAHVIYGAGEMPLSLTEYVAKGKKKSLLTPYIERSLGMDQIKHMERLLEEDMNGNQESTRTYTDI
jgi:hypothetical protein